MSHKQADHVCPPFIGYFLLANPLRRLLYTPTSIVAAYVTEGMTVIEPGPGMGFFTLELARLVGASGRVVALDIQPRMLKMIAQRAARADLLGHVDLRLIENDSLGIDDLMGRADFFLAFAMVHEVPDPRRFFKEAFASLKKGARLLLVEPRGHVSEPMYKEELGYAETAGFRVESHPAIRMSRATLVVKEERGKAHRSRSIHGTRKKGGPRKVARKPLRGGKADQLHNRTRQQRPRHER